MRRRRQHTALFATVLAVALLVFGTTAASYADIVEDAAEAYGVPVALIEAVIHAESGGDPWAWRYEPHLGEGSVGLMQLLYSTAGDLGFDGHLLALFDPATNVGLGTRYLAQQLEWFGNERVAVAAYNAGPGRVGRLVEEHGGDYEDIREALPPSTRAYVARVMERYEGSYE